MSSRPYRFGHKKQVCDAQINMSDRCDFAQSFHRPGNWDGMMFGVVLWSDPQEQKAVIWCEDHGDLAFYRQSKDAIAVPLDAGDWVQFDMTMECQQRRVVNPRLVAEGVCPDIADVLSSSVDRSVSSIRSEPFRRQSAQVVPFRRPASMPHRRVEGATLHQN